MILDQASDSNHLIFHVCGPTLRILLAARQFVLILGEDRLLGSFLRLGIADLDTAKLEFLQAALGGRS